MRLDELVSVAGSTIEVLRIPGDAGPPIVLLHEGLGSARLWRSFPEALASATGHTVIAPSRRGHGRSAPLDGPLGLDFMTIEAEEGMPEVLAKMDVHRPWLVGHSDGASIAILHAAGHPVAGLVLIAPHVFVEDVTIEGITDARRRFETGDMLARMARHHDDAEALFAAWTGVWLDPSFRSWNIESSLGRIDRPVLVIQGEDDEYGSAAQIRAVVTGCAGRVETLLLPGCGHSPHLDRPEAVVNAIAGFMSSRWAVAP